MQESPIRTSSVEGTQVEGDVKTHSRKSPRVSVSLRRQHYMEQCSTLHNRRTVLPLGINVRDLSTQCVKSANISVTTQSGFRPTAFPYWRNCVLWVGTNRGFGAIQDRDPKEEVYLLIGGRPPLVELSLPVEACTAPSFC